MGRLACGRGLLCLHNQSDIFDSFVCFADPSFESRASADLVSLNQSQPWRTQNVRDMFNQIATRYDLLNGIVSLGLDRGWRKKTVEELQLAPRGVVLDLACGTSPLAKDIESAGLTAVGLDISEQMMLNSPVKAVHVLGDCLSLPVKGESVEGVVCGFALRHFVSVAPLLREAARVLCPYGRLALLELDIPKPGWLKWGHSIYCRNFIPLVGRLLADKSAYEYLVESLDMLPAHGLLERELAEAGFEDVQRFSLSSGIAQLVTATKMGAAS